MIYRYIIKKFVCLFACAATLLASLCLPSAADSERLCFYLDAVYHPEHEMVTVELVCGGGELAGAMFEIEYDSRLSFTSAESLFDGLDFSCSLSDVGTVRVLFDNARNVCLKGSMALLSFSLTEGTAGSFAFGLRCLDEEDIYGIGVYDFEFYTVEAELYGCFVDVPMKKTDPSVKYLGFYSETLEDGNKKLSFVGSGASKGLGFELCAVDPMKGTVKTYSLAPMFTDREGLDDSCFISEYQLPRDSLMLCLFVRAFEDSGEGRAYGEESVHFFYKGIYTEYDKKINRQLDG